MKRFGEQTGVGIGGLLGPGGFQSGWQSLSGVPESPHERLTITTRFNASDIGFDVRGRLPTCINGP